LYGGFWFTESCFVSNGSAQGSSFELPGTGIVPSYFDMGNVSSVTEICCGNRTSQTVFVSGESFYCFCLCAYEN